MTFKIGDLIYYRYTNQLAIWLGANDGGLVELLIFHDLDVCTRAIAGTDVFGSEWIRNNCRLVSRARVSSSASNRLKR